MHVEVIFSVILILIMALVGIEIAAFLNPCFKFESDKVHVGMGIWITNLSVPNADSQKFGNDSFVLTRQVISPLSLDHATAHYWGLFGLSIGSTAITIVLLFIYIARIASNALYHGTVRNVCIILEVIVACANATIAIIVTMLLQNDMEHVRDVSFYLLWIATGISILTVVLEIICHCLPKHHAEPAKDNEMLHLNFL